MSFPLLPRSAPRLALAMLLAGLSAVSLASAAEAGATHLTIATASPVPRHVQLGLNKSMIIDLPANAREVIVSQPTIASATMRSQRRAIIAGTGAGDTNMFFIDDQGRQIATLDVSVAQDDSALSETLARLLPGSNIQVVGFQNHLVLSGTALSQDDVAKATAIAGQFAASPNDVTNVVTVSGAQQVNLKVTVAEVERSAVKQLGIDFSASLTSGSLTTGLINSPPMGSVSGVAYPSTISADVNLPGLSLGATLHALEQRGVMRTLDEPTLTALSGQPAEFLVGGEFPYQTTDNNGNATTAFKKYGVQLNFTPTVKSNGQIQLLVDTSVSEPAGQGAITERSAKTTVELPAGSTLSIAGLFEDQMRQQISSLPGIGNIPILGALFRSRDFIHDQTELVILVTPYLANPGAAPPLPTDGVVAAGDAESTFLGRMQKLYGVGDPRRHGGAYQGSVGFSLE